MSGRPGKALTREDRVLWLKVARSVAPLAGKAALKDEGEEEEFPALLASDAGPGVTPGPTAPPYRAQPPARQTQPTPHRLDAPTRDKLARGRLKIEGKVDLHGLTQSEAHALLLSFLHRAYADGRRHVLVVTGKGSSLGSEGVLRRAVPVWLATPPFRALVGAYEDAARQHGGSGAIYVRLRRPASAAP